VERRDVGTLPLRSMLVAAILSVAIASGIGP
jgi:hypothetical protein